LDSSVPFIEVPPYVRFQGKEGPERCPVTVVGALHPGPFRPCAGSVARRSGKQRRKELPEATRKIGSVIESTRLAPLLRDYQRKGNGMSDEVTEFARSVGAIDLKELFDYSEFHGLFKQRNYFLLSKDKFLIIKISRNNTKPFFGFGKKFFELFNLLTEKSGDYFFVALISNRSGWVLSKSQILNQISNRALSYSNDQEQYKFNNYNLKDSDAFYSPDGFLRKIGVAKE
jgi:hypothetical protein